MSDSHDNDSGQTGGDPVEETAPSTGEAAAAGEADEAGEASPATSAGDNAEFWEEANTSPRRSGSGSGSGGSAKKTLPLVAAAAGVLLVVIIIVIANSGKDNKSSSASSSSSSSVATADSGASSSGAKAKKKAAWPYGLGGAPAGFKGANGDAAGPTPASGVYFWNGYDGWHARVVKGPQLDGATVTVTGPTAKDTSPKAGSSVKRVVGVAPSAAAATQNKVVLTVPAGAPEVTGVDFNLGFYTDQVFLEVRRPDGSLVPVELIRVGGAAVPAKTNPDNFKKK